MNRMGWIQFAFIVGAYKKKLVNLRWLKKVNHNNKNDDHEEEERETPNESKNLSSNDILSNQCEKYANNEACMCLLPEAE